MGPPLTIDLNADIGEGFGVWRMGDDDAMLRVVTSANVACGFHAGDPEIMAHCFASAGANGVSIGAHVSFPDLAGFGRRSLGLSASEIETAVAYQLGAAEALARRAGHRVVYVKAHGALANLAERDAPTADAIARAVAAVDSSLVLLAIACSEQVGAAERNGLAAAHEIFADRAYAEDGHLAPRSEAGAVIDDPGAVADRVREMLEAGAIITRGGVRLPTPIDSVCVHGDTPHAVEAARALRAALERAGWELRPFAARA